MMVAEELEIPVSRSGHTIQRGDIYSWGDIRVVPRPSDKMLAFAYLRFDREKLLDRIFYEGVPSISWFLQKYAEIQCFACYRVTGNDQDEIELFGLGWVGAQETLANGWKKGEVGMAFFRKTEHRLTVDGSKLMLEYVFEELDFDVLYGTTPEQNPAAVAHARRLGFDIHGPVEGYCTWQGKPCGAMISSITRERWNTMEDFDGRG